MVPIIRLRLLLVLVTLSVFGQTSFAQSDDLEQFLSAPFRSGLTASPEGARIAWVDQIRGERAIVVADAPDFSPRHLANFADDDGLTVGSLQFTPDGRTIVFTHGSGRNRAGEFPNPSGMTEQPDQRVTGLDVKTGRSWSIAETGGVTISPDGSDAIFSRGTTVYIAPVSGGDATPLFSVRRGAGQLAWSPDGRSIAFISSRGDQAYVGVYSRGEDRVRWISPSIDRDRSPVWSPDGSMIAFYRMEGAAPDAADTIFGPYSEPYSIWTARADGSDARELWRSQRDGRDGYPAISGTRPLRWADDRTLIFPAETTGWTHLYALQIDSGEAKALTSGECIVEETDFDAASGWLYFNHNCGDVERRILSRVHHATGESQRLTDGSHVVEWAPTIVGDRLAFIRSTWQEPGTVHIGTSSGDDFRAIHSSDGSGYDASRMIRPEAIRYTSSDGLEISAQLFRPAGEGPFPAIVYLHGGSRRQMFPAYHYGIYYHSAYAYNQYLASLGYAVLSINYRSGIGYGKDFRQPADYGWRGASEYLDVRSAGEWLADQDFVDSERIGLWGGSYGGYLTAMGLARDSEMFKAGFDLHGVHNWVTSLRFWQSSRFASDIPERIAEADSLERLARASSPIADVNRWASPVLFVHGDDDRNVDVYETAEMVRLLREKGDVPVETLIFPDEVHSFLRYESWLRTYEAATDFFLRHLPLQP
jgi:dipeptidyl aminopeptidase/acylaminoacyl peptidase